MRNQHTLASMLAASTVRISIGSLILVAVFLSGRVHAEKEVADDDARWPDDVAGHWSVRFLSHNGPPVPAEFGRAWIFDDKKRLLIWADITDDFAIAFKPIFTEGRFRQLDLMPVDDDEVVLRAIFEVSGGYMRVCRGNYKGARPTDFDSLTSDTHTTFLQQTPPLSMQSARNGH